MATVNHPLELYRVLWTLLQARAAVTASIKPGNMIRLDQSKANPLKSPDQIKADGDLPQLLIELPQFDAAPTTQTFAMQVAATPAANIAWVEEQSIGFTMKLTHRDLDYAAATQLLAECIAAIRSGGPNLGKQYVTKVGRYTTRWDNQIELDRKKRLVSRTTFTVTTRAQGNTLL